MQANARLSERAPFFAEVDVLSSGAQAPRRVWGTDVSETGIFLQTTHPYRVGDRVSLRFDVADNEVHVRAAEVIWVRPFEPIAVDGRLPGIGVRFVALDPPARSALRKLVRKEIIVDLKLTRGLTSGSGGGSGSGMKRKGDTTLPDPDCQAIPQLPPARASLPPITQSILMATSTSMKPVTDEMLAISIPPFTEPPKKNSLPPDEPLTGVMLSIAMASPMATSTSTNERMFENAPVPRPVTMLPVKKKRTTPPLGSIPPVHPLAGWTFRVDDDVPEPADGSPAHTAPAHSDNARHEAAFERALEMVANDFEVRATDPGSMSFDSGAPAHAKMPAPQAAAPTPKLNLRFDDEDPGTSLPPERSIHDVETSVPATASMVLASDGQPEPDVDANDHAIDDSNIAISGLPVAHERRSSTKRRVGAMPIAATILVAGALVGTAIGFVTKQEPAAIAKIESVAPSAETTTMASVAPTFVPPQTVTPPAPAPVEVPAIVPLTVAQAEQEIVPQEKKEKPKQASVAAPPKVEKGGKLIVDAGIGAHVQKAFTLDAPARVVVDVVDASLPKGAHGSNAPGVARVRYGTPAPGVGRVVVELDGKSAAAVQAKMSGRRLVITWN